MTIEDAAKATRAHRVYIYADFCLVAGVRYAALDEAQAACDLLNAEAFLLAIREPSAALMEMMDGDIHFGRRTDWRAMIDALLTEIRALHDALAKEPEL